MDTQIMLIVAPVTGLLLILALVVSLRRRASRRLDRRVSATIIQIQVEASSFSSWWTITAAWSDQQTGQTYHFRSSHLPFRPKYHIGEQVPVNFDTSKPKHYRMEL